MTESSSRVRPLLRRLVPLAVLALAGAGAAVWALGEKPARVESAAARSVDRPVLVRKVKREPLVAPRVLVGTIRARVEADQGFRIAGKIARRAAQSGDRVKTGAVLAVLDEADLRLNREAAEAERVAAEAALKQAELERDRIAELRARGWSTEQAADRQRAAVAEAQGRAARAERQVELTRNAETYAVLRAEHDGTVTAQLAEAGQVVAAGQPVFRIARDGDREAQVSIPEQDLAFARRGHAEVSLWSDPERRHAAELRELAPSADAATRTFLARFTIAGIAPDAPLGMTATLTLRDDETEMAVRVPLSAILNQGETPQVFVVDPVSGQLELRRVRVVRYDARDALVSSGLGEGELIVTLGVHKLRAGQKVRQLPESVAG